MSPSGSMGRMPMAYAGSRNQIKRRVYLNQIFFDIMFISWKFIMKPVFEFPNSNLPITRICVGGSNVWNRIAECFNKIVYHQLSVIFNQLDNTFLNSFFWKIFHFEKYFKFWILTLLKGGYWNHQSIRSSWPWRPDSRMAQRKT